MPAIARVIPALALAFALLALALGVYEWANPPFTDARIQASIKDTWEVAASTTRVFAVVFLGLGMISVALARKLPPGGARVIAWLAAAICAITLVVFLRNHVELTERTTRLTGTQFGAAYGLL